LATIKRVLCNQPMELSLNAPALVFPTVSLLMLAYTNRFLAIAHLIRNLHAQHRQRPDPDLVAQIKNLRFRLRLIRDMQVIGVCSLFLSVASMFLIFEQQLNWATYTFAFSLLLLMVSLSMSIAELLASIKALNIQLRDIEDERGFEVHP
jgi:Protein of unknown function (DUF2721)